MSLRDIRRHIGQFAIAGFDGLSIPPELGRLSREFDLGGVILFGRNVEAPEQVAQLTYDAQALTREWPLWVSVDQEGGRVARLRAPFTQWPPMRTLGRSGDAQLAERFARALASELTAVGVSLDYAPVLDVHTNPHNPVIGDRALSDDPEVVARLGATIIRTLQAHGLAACGKHFPGHGDTSQDSHEELPIVDQDPERLRQRELVPFRAAVASDVAVIMTAHVVVPAWDAERPATLSRAIVHDILRTELGYDGLVATDDLGMRAVSASQSVETLAVGAVAAGCDLLLLCNTDPDGQVAALEALIHAVEDGTLAARDVEAALQRQRRAKERFLAPGLAARPSTRLADLIGRGESWAVAEEMSRYA